MKRFCLYLFLVLAFFSCNEKQGRVFNIVKNKDKVIEFLDANLIGIAYKFSVSEEIDNDVEAYCGRRKQYFIDLLNGDRGKIAAFQNYQYELYKKFIEAGFYSIYVVQLDFDEAFFTALMKEYGEYYISAPLLIEFIANRPPDLVAD